MEKRELTGSLAKRQLKKMENFDCSAIIEKDFSVKLQEAKI